MPSVPAILASTLQAQLPPPILQPISNNALTLLSTLPRSTILSIASKPSTTTLLLTLLTTHLLSTSSPAFYITQTAFPAAALATQLTARLHARPIQRGGFVYGPSDAVAPRVDAALARVSVLRVFDAEGALEALAEVRALLADRAEPRRHADGRQGEVPDSQDDEEEGGGIADAAPLLIMPGLPGLITPLIRANHVRGQAMLAYLLRSVRALARSAGVVVVLGNGVVEDGRGASAFAERRYRPALGRVLAQGVDVSVLVGEETLGGRKVGVVEVIGDRSGKRMGRWGCVEERNGEMVEVSDGI